MFHSVFCLGTSVFPGLEQGLAGPLLAFVIKFCWNTVMLFCYIAFMATFMLQRQRCISATETKWPVKAKIFRRFYYRNKTIPKNIMKKYFS